jgi:hypothetical protein
MKAICYLLVHKTKKYLILYIFIVWNPVNPKYLSKSESRVEDS